MTPAQKAGWKWQKQWQKLGINQERSIKTYLQSLLRSQGKEKALMRFFVPLPYYGGSCKGAASPSRYNSNQWQRRYTKIYGGQDDDLLSYWNERRGIDFINVKACITHVLE